MNYNPGLLLPLLGYLLSAVLFLAFTVFAVVSVSERENRAAHRAMLFAVLIPLPIFIGSVYASPAQQTALIFLISLYVAFALIVLLPIRVRKIKSDRYPNSQIDERDIMFSRRLLIPGTERYTAYYKNNPGKKTTDDKFRQNPGLLSKKSSFYNPFQFAAADASFNTVTALHSILDQARPSIPPADIDPQDVSVFIKNWALKLGAKAAGITFLRDYHKYSVVGRGADFGKEVVLDHKFAIAITVEMDKEMVSHAPYGPTVMESAQQYMDSGSIAVQIAELIKNLGHPARAHIDGNYRVICPLVARDAGLGELGRMGLLMTPKLGPRVRIAVITTDIPLIPDEIPEDESVQEFCGRCKKCADTCPAKAISFNDPEPVDGITRWQINQEMCFSYWTVSGTDCARCISVCPYAHEDNLLHNLVRSGLKQSSLFQILALKMDNYFYGVKPPPRKVKGYLALNEKRQNPE